MFVKLHGNQKDINIIKTYALTSEREEAELESVYKSLEKVLVQCKMHEINLT